MAKAEVTIPLGIAHRRVLKTEINPRCEAVITIESTKDGTNCHWCGRWITKSHGDGQRANVKPKLSSWASDETEIEDSLSFAGYPIDNSGPGLLSVSVSPLTGLSRSILSPISYGRKFLLTYVHFARYNVRTNYYYMYVRRCHENSHSNAIKNRYLQFA